MSLTHRGSFDLSVKTADKLSLATNSGRQTRGSGAMCRPFTFTLQLPMALGNK